MRNADENEAFESAVSRLPHPVFVVDNESRLRAINTEAKQLWVEERMDESQIQRSPLHPFSKVILAIRAEQVGEDEETMVLQLSGGTRYEVIHSTRSPKGQGRWLMLILRPFPTELMIDRAALARRWSLTPKEAEVAAACIAGRTSEEICEALTITRGTLKTHIARLLDKADCANRSQLVARYLFGD